MKVAEGNEKRWYKYTHAVFWAEQITISKATRRLSYYIVYKTELLLLFNLSKAMYLVELLEQLMSTEELIRVRV